ncbi:MAG: amidohydrolase family protein [Gammaproteobacteria bacterium]|nr:amidohydrolase family protein [Gammaproteobacteria bacterium]
MHDLAIRNAIICDGSGAPRYPGEVAVTDGMISELGPQVGRAHEEVDADGQVLAPGIIDNHTHYDAQITWDAYASPTLGLGVTTLIMGNCGFTIAPCRPGDREQTLKNLTQVEGMSLDALLEGTRTEFETFSDYLGMIESLGVVPNVAVYCGHSSVRTWVMGEDAVKRTATDGEITAMQAVIKEALAQGAIGFATSTFEGHNGWGGVPMPSRFADQAEMAALVGTLGEVGAGRFMLTKGNPSPVPYLERLAASTGQPVAVAAIQYDHSKPERAFGDMQAIGEAVERGARMMGQVACTAISMDFTLRSAYLFEALKAWKPAIGMYDDVDALRRFYRDRSFRAAMQAELLDPKALNRFTDQWDKVEILEVAKQEHRALEGRMVAELAREAGKDPLDWLLDFGDSEDFQTLFNAQILNADEDQVLHLLKHPHSTIGLADAGAHLFLFCDADFGLHLLGHWTRERGDFSLEEAVAELTSRQADAYGIQKRGLLREGYHADLLLFDPVTVGRGAKERVFDLPAGASRLIRHGNGIAGLWVNGVRVMDGQGVIHNGARPGRVLREFNA